MHRRRIRLRQIDDRAGDHAASAAARRADLVRAHPARRHRPRQPWRKPDAAHPRRPYRDDLPGADDLAQPGAVDRPAADRVDRGAYRPVARRGAPARRRGAEGRAHLRSRKPAEAISARALRRHAPARDDRHGAGLAAGRADRRRADDGARRHRAGRGAGTAARPAARARHQRHPDHPRHGRGRRDGGPGHRHALRPHGRGRQGRRHLRQARRPPIRASCWPPCRASAPARGGKAPGLAPADPASRGRGGQRPQCPLRYARRLLRPGEPPRPRRRRRQLLDRAERDAGAGRRIRLRQVDDRQGAGRAGALQRRHRDRRAQSRRARPRGAQGGAPRRADDLPGPLCLARSAHAGRRSRRRAAADPRHRLARGAPRPRRSAVRARRPVGRPDGALSARILGRPAPAHLHRPRA